MANYAGHQSGSSAHVLLTAIERVLRQHSPGASTAYRFGAVIFIHRFGQNIRRASSRPLVTATLVATRPGIMNE